METPIWMNPENKYYLLALHKEIDLFDRKIAHAKNIESFDSDHSKVLAIKKLETKRAALVATATDLASKGVEYDPQWLPRSFKATLEKTAAGKTAD
jgi:hypothetical protein